MMPTPIEALALLQRGKHQEAEHACRQILAADPLDSVAWHTLGLAALGQRDLPAAIEHLTKAAAQGATSAIYCDLGAAWGMSGRPDQAESCFRRAIEMDPQFPAAWNNLGNTLKSLGKTDEAMSAYRQAILLATQHPGAPEVQAANAQVHIDAVFNLANLLREIGQFEEAIEHYRRALALAPERTAVLTNLGSALQSARREEEAIAVYRQSIALDAGAAEAHLNLGLLLAERDESDEGARLVERAGRLRPDRPLWGMRMAGFCPTIFQTEEELDAYRQELGTKLDAYASVPLRYRDEDALARDAFTPSFNLAHHGRDNRRLMEKFAALYAPHIRRREPRRNLGKPRMGFLVTSPHEEGFLRTMGGVIAGLDPERFQTVVFCHERAMPTCRNALRRESIEWVPLPERFLQAADRVLEARCDLLYFHKVGADPLGYLLPFARLAPVQCTSWSTHLTSGVSEVDYYISSRFIESHASDCQYTERLVRLASLPIYESRPAPLAPATRGEFGLPENGRLYVCPQRLAKFHPAEDSLLRGILVADPAGLLVIFSMPNRDAELRSLLRRFARTLGPVAARVRVVPPRSHAEFRRMLSVCDVFLDLKHYGASLMAFDALLVDLPIVTKLGNLKVERYGQAFYARMGIDGPIACSDEEYIHLAVRLATDADYGRAVRNGIAEAKGVLLDDPSVVREYERFFEDALMKHRDASGATH